MRIPIKPFPSYKWRWAEYTPSEGLNNPVRFMGVLRAIYKHQGKPKSTNDIYEDLLKVEKETNQLTGEDVTLARTGERNLFRNSDRYWKALGLLDSLSRPFLLTPLGNNLAEGKITQNEFAISSIKALTLPNEYIESEEEIEKWQYSNLRINPLELILQIIKALFDNFGEKNSYLTPFELQKVIIPYAGDNATLEEYVIAIQAFRNGKLDVNTLPDCATGANDKRMVREFLLFLSNYGFCDRVQPNKRNNAQEKYFLCKEYIYEIDEISKISSLNITIENIVQEVRRNPVITDVERQKVLTRVSARPQQANFRKQVLSKFGYTCLLTGEKMNVVLEACHIIPVESRGNDVYENGICFRSDIHILYDTKNIRIRPDGHLEYSDAIQQSSSYSNLPKQVDIPNFVSKEALNWRYDYY